MDSSEFDLTFPMLEFGARETPWDLRPLPFRGGPAAKVKHVGRQIAQSSPTPRATGPPDRAGGTRQPLTGTFRAGDAAA